MPEALSSRFDVDCATAFPNGIPPLYPRFDDGYLHALEVDRDIPYPDPRATLAWRYWVGYPIRCTACLVPF